MSTRTKIWIGVAIVAVIVIMYVLSGYNGLVVMKENSLAQWQQVETQYQRRFDLIPNLVSSVQGAMKQEKDVFTAIAEARTRYAGAQTTNEKVAATGQVESALGRLLAVIESYPTLKSTDAVQGLMAQLEGTENRIAVERQRYNDSVRGYQVAIKTFPRSIIASIFNFDSLTYFEADKDAAKAPTVQF